MRVGFEGTRKSGVVVTGELSFIRLLWFASRADSYSAVWLSCSLIKIYNYFLMFGLLRAQRGGGLPPRLGVIFFGSRRDIYSLDFLEVSLKT